MLNTIHALLFDLDDTLYSRNDAFRRWAQEFVHNDLELAEDDPHYQEAIEQIIDLDEQGYSPREMLFHKIKEAHHPKLPKSAGQLLETYKRQFLNHIRKNEETEHLLTALKSAGLPFGIITNGATSRQLYKVHTLGFDQLTSCIFISEQFGCEKPDAAIFLAAAACLGHKPENILFVGDHPQKDIWGAHCIGMQTVWLRHQREWPSEPALPNYIVDSIGELCTILDISSK